jgi:GDP-4-dehydro-6-deoxy-D-mannose reductase
MTSPFRILITGATGFTGIHLSRLALSRGANVFGLARASVFVPGVIGYLGDIAQRAFVEKVIKDVRPNWVIHLAALLPGASGTSSEDYFRVNVGGTQVLLEAIRCFAPSARVLIASSSAVYGQPHQVENAISEDAPFQPANIYAVTKVAQEMLAIQFGVQHGLYVVRSRAFNQTGPLEPVNLVCATFARQIANIESGQQEPFLRAKTLATSRDFTDVRDVVSGYWAALQFGEDGQSYNICSGYAVSIQNIAKILIRLSKTTHIQVVETQIPPELNSVTAQIGDPSRLKVCSDWQPTISLEQSLGDLLNEQRLIVSADLQK